MKENYQVIVLFVALFALVLLGALTTIFIGTSTIKYWGLVAVPNLIIYGWLIYKFYNEYLRRN